MPRFVVFRPSKSTTPSSRPFTDLEMIQGVRIIETISDRGCLLEAPEDALLELQAALPDCVIDRESTHSLPRDPQIPDTSGDGES